MLHTTEDGQLFCGPVDWLQDCGVAFMGQCRGWRWCLDDLSGARSDCRFSGNVCCGRQSHGRAARSSYTSSPLRPLRRAAGERAKVGEVRGAQLGKRLPRLGAAWGQQLQITNNNPPASRSPVCLAPPRTSSESGSGSRTKVTLWSPPLTRRVRTQPSTRSLSTLRSSLPLRESHLFTQKNCSALGCAAL